MRTDSKRYVCVVPGDLLISLLVVSHFSMRLKMERSWGRFRSLKMEGKVWHNYLGIWKRKWTIEKRYDCRAAQGSI